MRSLYPPMAFMLAAAVAIAPAEATQFTSVFTTHLADNSAVTGTSMSFVGAPASGSAAVPGGLTASVTAWNGNVTNGTTTIKQATLGEWAGGLGVISSYDNLNGCGVGDCGMHQIDNVGNTTGSTSFDFVQVTFSQAVTLVGMSRVAFAQVNTKGTSWSIDDTTVWDDDAAYGRGASLADIRKNNANVFQPVYDGKQMSFANFSSMIGTGVGSGDASNPSNSDGSCKANSTLYGSSVCKDSPTFGTASYDYTASTTWWIAASLLNPDNKGDAFKLFNFTVVYNDMPGPVPEPASWTMMIAGFGFVGSAMRRKKAAERLAAA